MEALTKLLFKGLSRYDIVMLFAWIIEISLQFNRYGRAFDIFQEMRDKNFQGNWYLS